MAKTENVGPLTDAMCAVADLGFAMGIHDICKLPGCYELQIDKHWWIAMNGHWEKIKCSKGVTIDPFHCYVEWNGWPAGIFSAFGGSIVCGEAANENTFIEAVKVATAKALKETEK